MNNIEFTTSGAYLNDGVLVTGIDVTLNDENFSEVIPYFLNGGFQVSDVLNAVSCSLSDEQEQAIADRIAQLNDETKAMLNARAKKIAINSVEVKDDFTYFNLNFDGEIFRCRKEAHAKTFEIEQSELSFKYQTEVWEECNFLSVDDLQFNFVKQHVSDCEVMTEDHWSSPLFVIRFKQGDDKCHFEEWISGDRDDGYHLERTDSSYYNGNLYDKLFNSFQSLISDDEFFKVCEKIFAEWVRANPGDLS